MKPIPKQVKKYLDGLSEEEVQQLRDRLSSTPSAEHDACNVATKVELKQSLFDTCQDETVTTIELDEKILTDFQTLRKSQGEDIRKTLLALMAFYSNHEQLNLVLMHDALANRQSYIKFTAQLANYLARHQSAYKQVKVQFDATTSRLGIFCRTGTETSSLNINFLGTIIASLKIWNVIEIDIKSVPMSYLGNRAMLKHILTHRLGGVPKITWNKTGVIVSRPA